MRSSIEISICWHPTHSVGWISNWNQRSFFLSLLSSMHVPCSLFSKFNISIHIFTPIICCHLVIVSLQPLLQFQHSALKCEIHCNVQFIPSSLHVRKAGAWPALRRHDVPLSVDGNDWKNSWGRCWASSCLDKTDGTKKSNQKLWEDNHKDRLCDFGFSDYTFWRRCRAIFKD